MEYTTKVGYACLPQCLSGSNHLAMVHTACVAAVAIRPWRSGVQIPSRAAVCWFVQIN